VNKLESRLNQTFDQVSICWFNL